MKFKSFDKRKLICLSLFILTISLISALVFYADELTENNPNSLGTIASPITYQACLTFQAKKNISLNSFGVRQHVILPASNCQVFIQNATGGDGSPSGRGTPVYTGILSFGGSKCDISPPIIINESEHFTLCINRTAGNYNFAYDSNIFINNSLTNINFTNVGWNDENYVINVSQVVANITTQHIHQLTENSQTFSTTVYSDELKVFEINITFDSFYWTSVSAKLNYNNTNYTGNSYISGDDTIINTTITIPKVSVETNKTFYWIISLTNTTGTFDFNSTSNNQTISSFKIYVCNATYNVTYVNFTTKDAETLDVLNSSFKITFTIGNSNKSFSNTTELLNSFAYCFEPSYIDYNTSAIIEYDKTGYAKNYYYLTYANLSNSTQNINLYLLNDSKATLTELEVLDTAQRGISNVYITIQRYDVSTDTYYTVGMAKTSDEGKDLAYLNWYDTFYRFILVSNEQVIKTTSIRKISETPQKFIITDITIFEYDKFDNIIYTLTFNNVTNNFILTYILPSGEISEACLRVIKRSARNDTTICDTCETSSSATIYCNINAYGNGTFIGTFYAKGSLGYIDSLVILKDIANEIFDLIGNTDGSIYAFLFAGIVTFLFFFSPVMGIIGVILGMLGAMILGFQPVNYIEFIGIVIIAGVIIWILKR